MQQAQSLRSQDTKNKHLNDDRGSNSSDDDSNSKPTFGTKDTTQIITKSLKERLNENKINLFLKLENNCLLISQTLAQTAQTLDTVMLQLTQLNNDLDTLKVSKAQINFGNQAQNQPATVGNCQQYLTSTRQRITSEKLGLGLQSIRLKGLQVKKT